MRIAWSERPIITPLLLASVCVLLLLGDCSCSASGGDADGGGSDDEDRSPSAGAGPLPVDASRRLCDGSSSLRLAVQGMAGDLLPNGESVWFENGAHFLFVDGTCRYWVQLQPAQGMRVGQLTQEQEEALSRDLLYRSWAALVGEWSGPAGTYDAGTHIFWDAQYTVACHRACNLPETPQQLRELVLGGYVDRILRPLWLQGSKPQAGGVRLVAVRGAVWYQDPFDWPLAQAVETYASDPSVSVGFGESRLVAEEADVVALRGLRAAYEASSAPNSTAGKIPVLGSEGTVYGLFMRDTLPFEDARGLVRSPRR